MEKLIKLLNEYGKEHFEKCTNSENELRIRKEICTEAYDEEIIISKKFGFIKWLVDNDKIDQTIIDGNFGYFCMEGFDNVDSLLMVLAISDTPIEDLISYLK